MYKEYYIEKLPMYLQHLVPTEPLGIEKNYEKDYFIQCTKSSIYIEDYNRVLYHILLLIYRY
ncbi:hypothetical protein vBEcoMphAPEC6_gp542c [Escherichia phage vB_EcoM_phAPEC6]|nr:hypothetical protein vBEcoMphAPEC6_gp542c [Escherichia phage vB_EcoM_phAPEC6]